tara:strand:+ start:108 stop:296 length:189 start_codon:yes stop_codon:yes gene_type:complete
MKYKNIKKELKRQVEGNINTIWTFDERNQHFVMRYQVFDNSLKVYTPQQLLDKLNTKDAKAA